MTMCLLTKINFVTTFLFLISFVLGCNNSPKKDSLKEIVKNDLSSESDKLTKSYVLKIDSQLDTSEYRERKRFINAFDMYSRYDCLYDTIVRKITNLALFRKLHLCTDSKEWGEIAYHLFLKPCAEITNEDFHIFTLDKEQKDSSILFIAICEGDSPIEKVPGTTLGVFLVLKKENNQYKLTDTGFGKLVAFDVDKNNRIQPIIYGESKNFNYPDYVIENDLPYHLEIRMAWNGEHLQANEVISAEFPKRNILETNGVEQVLSINEMKNLKLYDPLRQSYINQADDILNGVKIHWRFRSWSLKYKKEPDAIEQHKKKWTKGFKIE